MEATGLVQHLVSKMANTFKKGADLSEGKTETENFQERLCSHPKP